MAHTISSINLKGGVGKTTTIIAVAEILAGFFRKKVLLIDLDPQTNATTALIGDKKWKKLNDAGHTLATLFEDAVEERQPVFDLAATLQRNASNVREVHRLDLLPSSIDLIDVQDRLGSMSSGRFFALSPVDILRRAIRPIEDDYDYILIDCPPSMGIVTLNGLRISTGYFIPTIPDVLSTYGIPQIIQRVKSFSDSIGETIEPLGIVVSKYRAQSNVHNTTLRSLRAKGDAPVFETIIPENNAIAQSAESVSRNTLRQKYGYQGQFDAYYGLTKEIIQAVEA